MKPVIKMADSEAAIVSYLKTKLAARAESYVTGVKVGTRVPNPIPMPYVQVRRSGGVLGGLLIDHPLIDCLVWHNSAEQRMDLAQMVHALLRAISNDTANGVLLYAATDALSPIQVPDPVDGTQTVTLLTVEATVRGTQV
jgi:hypothetical protein